MSINPLLGELAEIARTELLATKWLLAPSLRVGNQWLESVVRNGQPAVGFRVLTLSHLAMDLAAGDLAAGDLAAGRFAAEKVSPLPEFAATLLMDHLLGEQQSEYLSHSEASTRLAAALLSAIDALRMAGCSANDLERIRFEVRGKGGDLCKLLNAYEAQLEALSVLDHAELFQRAIDRLETDPDVVPENLLLLVPDLLEPRGLEAKLLASFPQACCRPLPAGNGVPPATDIERLAFLVRPGEAGPPFADGSLQIFSATGEVNEIREVLRRILKSGIPLDEVELLHTDHDQYVPLIYEMAAGLAAEHSDEENGTTAPVTFAEGIPAHYGRPGRALAAWLTWIDEEYDQRLLVRMLHEGLLQVDDTKPVPAWRLTAALRTLPIGSGADRYLPKINEEIDRCSKKMAACQLQMEKSQAGAPQIGDEEAITERLSRLERDLAALKALEVLLERLLSISVAERADDILTNSCTLLESLTHGNTEVDNYARDGLLTDIKNMRDWLGRLGNVAPERLAAWLASLAERKRILGAGPRAGKLHVAHLRSGGHSGRSHTYIVGLDDGRFPGRAIQDPILLDREREQLSDSLIRSGEVVEKSVQDLVRTVSRLSGELTLSYPCWDLADDRQLFPSPIILSAFRIQTGDTEADQQSLEAALPPASSFVGDGAVLDESEWWLARLCSGSQIDEPLAEVYARYPHLAAGGAAQSDRTGSGLTMFDGLVPEAGNKLDPRNSTSPVSASGLETAGTCPLRYFFRYALQLKPIDELEIDPDRWLDPLAFGLLLHTVFETFLADLIGENKLPKFDRDLNRLMEVLNEQINHYRDRVPPPSEAAFLRQRAELKIATRIFLDAESDYCRTHKPEFFEAAIGLSAEGDGTPIDSDQPATIALPGGGSFRTRGRIDRIDNMGGGQFSICDYKTGSAWKFDEKKPFQQGRVVQNALYVAMIEPALKQHFGQAAEVAEFNYFFPSQKTWGRRIGWTGQELVEGLPTIERLCNLIASGAFVPTDKVKDCSYCDFKTACGDLTALTRASKTKIDNEQHLQLVPLRELRRSK